MDLKNLGCERRKTYNENHIPNISENLIIHFIRGYFDGDGCVCISNKTKHYKDKLYEYTYLTVNIVSKTKTILEEIKDFLLNYNIITLITYFPIKRIF